MKNERCQFTYEVYESERELPDADANLLQAAREATIDAYAPYSNFLVGTAARLANGQLITGSNQENASFPAGICAERVLLSAAASLYPRVSVKAMAVSYNNLHGGSTNPITPCGICRQSLAELEANSKQPLRLILAGLTGKVYVIPSASLLLPLAFSSSSLG